MHLCKTEIGTQYLTPRELANLLRLSQGTVTNWRRAGKGPRFVRAESTIRYAVSDVERWLRSENKPQGGQQWTQ